MSEPPSEQCLRVASLRLDVMLVVRKFFGAQELELQLERHGLDDARRREVRTTLEQVVLCESADETGVRH